MTKTTEPPEHQNDLPNDTSGSEPASSEEPVTDASPKAAGEEPTEAPSELEKRNEELEQQAAHYKDLFLRKAADFENFKRRTENEISALARFANEDLVLAFLPVVDDIERALKAAKDDDSEASLRKGIELILQKITKILENNGVKPMQTVGKSFDVHFHDVLLQIHKPDVEPHTIIEEVERGYLMHDRVLRHAKVVVAAGSDEGTAQTTERESTGRKPTPPGADETP